MNNLLNGVLRLREAGLSTIPIKADGSKAPALSSWKAYQERLPDEGELRQWFGNGARPGLALVGGKVSGNLEVMDFDAPELIAEWRALVEDAAPGLLEQLPQVETPSGGLHVFYRCAEIGGNSKLAQNAAGRTLVETRAEGGYVVTAGSPAACHSSGKLYRLVNGDLKTIPEITPGEREILLDCARSFNERVKLDPATPVEPPSGLRPGDDYNARGDTRADLGRHGWRYLRPGARGELWARPGVNHTSATRFPDGSLYVFSVNAAPFDSERVYAPFSIRALLDHGGDFAAAAKALAAEGFGERTAPKKRAAHFEQAEPENGKALVNLKNGTFEITADSQELRPFNPADFLKYQLPFIYNEEAKAPIFAAYLNRVLPETELQDIVSEFFGYVFTRKLKLEKALLLYGSGANGKSVLFDVMNALLGRENTANYSLSDLMAEHNRAQIAHKLLNYGSEINASVTKDVFKNLVSGEAIMARLKYGNSFLMEDYAKLCFNCNELPKDIEQTEAYFRRLLIVPFRVVIPEAEQDKELAQKIVAAELSGVFNWVLAGLRRLLTNKKFTASKIVEDVLSDYKRESDSVACYLDESEHEPAGLLKDVYTDYRDYCVKSGIKALGKQKFRKRLESHSFEVERINAGMRVSRKQE